jgi:hypothetical protein
LGLRATGDITVAGSIPAEEPMSNNMQKGTPKKSLHAINEEMKEAFARTSALLIEATHALAEGEILPFAQCSHPKELWKSYGPYHMQCRLCNGTCDRYGSSAVFKETV